MCNGKTSHIWLVVDELNRHSGYLPIEAILANLHLFSLICDFRSYVALSVNWYTPALIFSQSFACICHIFWPLAWIILTCAQSCAPQGSTVVLCMHTVCTVVGRVSRAWLQWHLRSDHGEGNDKQMQRNLLCKHGCSICSAWWGFTSIYHLRLYKNIKKLEGNSTVENNLKAIHKDKTPMMTKYRILFCERARSINSPATIRVESVSAKVKNIATKLLLEYERNTTIMEAEESDALKLHLFVCSCKWLKRNNYISKRLHGEAADVDLIAVADGGG